MAFFAVVAVAALVMSLDLPGGPSRELNGLVKGTVADARDGPPVQFATVALSKDQDVLAAVGSGLIVHTGQTVRVLQHRRIITGATTYEVVAIQEAK